MKNKLFSYKVNNNFVSETQDEMRNRINSKIRNLCLMDVEKIYSFDYNIDVTYLGDTSST